MSIHSNAVDPNIWTGRSDAEGALARRWHQMIEPWLPGAARGVALLGFSCDEGVRRNQGRIGAAEAPSALRRALANLPWHLDRPLYEAGDITCSDGDLEGAQRRLGEAVSALLADGQLPVVLGGGHEVAYGSFLGLANQVSATCKADAVPVLGILNFDAHFDLRASDQATSGTPFAQAATLCQARGWPFRYACMGVAQTSNTAALYARAKHLGVDFLEDDVLVPWRLAEALSWLDAFLNGIDQLYLTIDLDVLPAAQAPGVSAPAARGVELSMLETLIDHARRSGKLVLADIAEYNPRFDQDNHTARAAARLVHRLIRPIA